MIDIKYCSQKGLCDKNQDFILCKQLQDGSCIAILADGMGGLQYGEIAAVTVLYIKDDTAYYAWQGNVRLYYKKEKGIHLLTEDHLKQGDNCTFLTRCVNGRGFRYPISIQETKISDMDLLFLCTDGFYQAKDCLDSVIIENKLPSRIEDLEDDASCILIQLHNP